MPRHKEEGNDATTQQMQQQTGASTSEIAISDAHYEADNARVM
jgi:hypothetical protein